MESELGGAINSVMGSKRQLITTKKEIMKILILISMLPALQNIELIT